LGPILGLYGCRDFIILVNLSGEKVDFCLTRSPGRYSYSDFVVLVNLDGEKVDLFFCPISRASAVVLILLYY